MGDVDSDLIARLRNDARQIFQAGVDAAEPGGAVRRALEFGPRGQPLVAGRELAAGRELRVVAFGKAACSMAEAAAGAIGRDVFRGPGVVVVNAENRREVPRFEVHASGHPVPDAAGVAAAERVVSYLGGAGEGDGALVLISGGGSAILPAPAEGISLEDKVATTRELLACGATIHEMNTVRKHLSRLKGGGLARHAFPARLEALVLSDVVGDDLSTIASGPTAPDPSTFADARGILERHEVLQRVPPAVRDRLEGGMRGEVPETPKPGDPLFEGVRNAVVGSNSQSLDAAAAKATELGYQLIIASRALTGEARDVGVKLASYVRRKETNSPPLAILAGGETTVTVRGDGRGGRNQEMALSFALACERGNISFPWVFLSGGTDGRDGPTDAAGGIVDPRSVRRGREGGRDAEAELSRNNSYDFLAAAGDLLLTGATGTNVADLQVLLTG
ncbi:MAG: glycerate kinase [Planctomycetota bacterium]|nr:glycerate kinase [Planctomycetota bacterium]